MLHRRYIEKLKQYQINDIEILCIYLEDRVYYLREAYMNRMKTYVPQKHKDSVNNNDNNELLRTINNIQQQLIYLNMCLKHNIHYLSDITFSQSTKLWSKL